jgi:hypothetical protein
MENKLREKRLRMLVHRVNLDRKKQSKKIDILCNDFIDTHRNFIKNLDVLCFAANFYQSIIGQKNIDELFDATAASLRDKIKDAEVAFFLRHNESFDFFSSKHPKKEDAKEQSFESFFTDELVIDICKNNRLCSLEQMMTMGLQLVPSMLNKLSAYAVPLINCGTSIGFILIYRISEDKISPDELDNISSVSTGLARAMVACQSVHLHSTSDTYGMA